MRWLALFSCTTLSACTVGNPAFDTSGDSGNATGESTTTGPGTGDTTLSATADDNGDDETGNDADSSTTTADPTDSDSDAESTGTRTCDVEENDRLDVSVHDGDNAVPLCDALIIQGDVEAIDDTTWSVGACGCGDPACVMTYTIAISAPGDLLPVIPPCARLEIRGVATPDGCELDSLRIHASNGPVDPVMDPPLYLASRGRKNGDGAVQPGVFVSEQQLAGCQCPDDGCCPIEPGRYELGFYTGIEGDEVAWLGEGDTRIGRSAIPIAPFPASSLWDVAVLNAHVHPECGMRPHFDWIIRASAG